MAPETPHVGESSSTVISCLECGEPTLKTSNRTKYCPECRRERRRAQTRAHVAASRRRAQGGNLVNIPSQNDEHPELFTCTLACQHSVLFRVRPIEGEFLWCVRCQEWREFTNGMSRPLCPKRLHRMTPFNTAIDPATRRRCCKACLRDSMNSVE